MMLTRIGFAVAVIAGVTLAILIDLALRSVGL
jgi:hypothetical protein